MVVKNKSVTYLLPLVLDFLFKDHNKLIESFNLKKYVENTYTYGTKDNKQSNELFIVFHNPEKGDIYFSKILDIIKNSNIFVEEFTKDKYLVVQLSLTDSSLNIPYLKFINGKYSELTEQEKSLILAFVVKYAKKTTYYRVGQILYKEDSLRKELEKDLNVKIGKDQELNSIPDKLSETLILN